MNNRFHPLSVTALLTSLLLLVVLAAPVSAAGEKGSLSVYHDPVVVTLTNASSDGHQLGDLRVTSTELTDEDGQVIGRLEATLTTTAVDVPADGDEIRISTLVFSFGDGDVDQVVVGGSALYPAQGPTIATGNVTTRPIVGGSGRFSGAAGSAVTEHLADDSWVHMLSFSDSKMVKLDKKDTKDKSSKGSDADPGVAVVETDGPAIEEVGITRTDLGLARPGSAPGEELGLWQYRIPAGAELAPHTHAGWQIARIVRGALEYTIISGEGTIIHADGSSDPVGPGTYTLETGDSIVENPDLQHFGANTTEDEVVILAATLYTEGAPLSIPIE